MKQQQLTIFYNCLYFKDWSNVIIMKINFRVEQNMWLEHFCFTGFIYFISHAFTVKLLTAIKISNCSYCLYIKLFIFTIINELNINKIQSFNINGHNLI